MSGARIPVTKATKKARPRGGSAKPILDEVDLVSENEELAKTKTPGESLPGEIVGKINGFNVRRVRVADLEGADYNPREIDEPSLAGLKASVTEFGMVEAVVYNRRTRRIVGGHQRRKTLDPEATTDVVEVDLDEDREKVLNVALNSRHLQGDWTKDGLASLLAETQGALPELTEALRFDSLHEDVARLESLDLGEIDDVNLGNSGGEGGEDFGIRSRGSDRTGTEPMIYRLEVEFDDEARRDAALAALRAVSPDATLAENLEEVIRCSKPSPRKARK